MALLQLLMQLVAVLGPILSTPYAQKVMTCVANNLTNPTAMLACIAGAKMAAVSPDEQHVHDKVEKLLNDHIKHHP